MKHENPIITANTQKVIEYYRSPESGMKEFGSFTELKNELKKIGYKFGNEKLEKYISKGYISLPNKPELVGKPFYSYICPDIQEIDTKVSFAHYQNARRDENFNELQKLRKFAFVVINNAIFIP